MSWIPSRESLCWLLIGGATVDGMYECDCVFCYVDIFVDACVVVVFELLFSLSCCHRSVVGGIVVVVAVIIYSCRSCVLFCASSVLCT